jgi:hypothetical protein
VKLPAVATAPDSTRENTGLEVVDIERDPAFLARPLRSRGAAMQMEAMQRIAHALVESPETILQELVNVAVEGCGADSAGISIEKEDGTDEHFYHWVATAGGYSEFLDAVLPRYPSACGICLERGRAQYFTVGQRFFDLLGISAPLVTDGILLPWEVDATRGTIFVMAHGRTEAFDQSDYRLMHVLANFAALGVRERKQRELLLEKARVNAAAAMANDLAHRINNPLQSLTNVLYLAAHRGHGDQARAWNLQALEELERLSRLVRQLLSLPYDPSAEAPTPRHAPSLEG